MKLFGTLAMNSLRMEKAYRGWGGELTAEVDMVEASMERFLRLDKPDFIGKTATLEKKARGPRIVLVYGTLDATDADSLGNEPIYQGDRVVGLTTGGAYGHAVQASLAFAYVEPGLAAPGTVLDVLMFGERQRFTILGDAAWDPTNERIKA